MKKVVLFSAMTGQLLMHGEPIRHAKIRRVVNFGETPEDDLTDYTETDGEGRFSFDEKSHRGLSNYFLIQFACSQELFVEYKGLEMRFWEGSKSDPEPNAEARYEPLNVICELSAEKKITSIEGGTYYTQCDWGVLSDPLKDYGGFDTSLTDDDEGKEVTK